MTTLRPFEQQLASATPEQQVAFIWSLCSGLQIPTTHLLGLAQSIPDGTECDAANEAQAALTAPANSTLETAPMFQSLAIGSSTHQYRLVTATICSVWGVRPSLLAQTASDVLNAGFADFATARISNCASDGSITADAFQILQQAGEGLPPVVNRYAAQAAIAALFAPVIAAPRDPLDELIAVYHWTRQRMRRPKHAIFAQLAALLEIQEEELADLIVQIGRPDRAPMNLAHVEPADTYMARRARVLRFCQAANLSLQELSEFRRPPVRAQHPQPAGETEPAHSHAVEAAPEAVVPASVRRPARRVHRRVALSAILMLSVLALLTIVTAACVMSDGRPEAATRIVTVQP